MFFKRFTCTIAHILAGGTGPMHSFAMSISCDVVSKDVLKSFQYFAASLWRPIILACVSLQRKSFTDTFWWPHFSIWRLKKKKKLVASWHLPKKVNFRPWILTIDFIGLYICKCHFVNKGSERIKQSYQLASQNGRNKTSTV